MSLGPQPTSAMAPYGLPCAFSSEQEVRSKTARRVAPTAVEVNAEGVIQLDGISTRGMFMFGGPNTYERQVTILPNATNAITLSPDQLVDGILVITDSVALTQVNLPTVLALNAYVNSNLVSNAAALIVPAAIASAPRTTFKLTIITNQRVDFGMPALTPVPGHGVGASGYQFLDVPAQAVGDITAVSPIAPAGVIQNVITTSATTTPRVAVDVYFFQTAGTGTDPEWMFLSN